MITVVIDLFTLLDPKLRFRHLSVGQNDGGLCVSLHNRRRHLERLGIIPNRDAELVVFDSFYVDRYYVFFSGYHRHN